MKKIKIFGFIICGFIGASAQTKLEVTYNKSTNLIFPAAITSVDRGSTSILVQKATGAENILRVKADVKDFAETSLSVITGDGKLYSFLVTYSSQPAYLDMTVRDSSKLIFSPDYTDSVLAKGPNINAVRDENSGASISLTALYIHENVLYLLFDLQNTAAINYDIDQLHFYIRDKNKSKRTASQELEVKPVSITGNTTVIRGASGQACVVTLGKFTIPDGKLLVIEMMEKNGGRNLLLKITNRKIMKAKII